LDEGRKKKGETYGNTTKDVGSGSDEGGKEEGSERVRKRKIEKEKRIYPLKREATPSALTICRPASTIPL